MEGSLLRRKGASFTQCPTGTIIFNNDKISFKEVKCYFFKINKILQIIITHTMYANIW